MRFGAIAGPQGIPGSPYLPVGVLVYSEADLPAPVANVVTLQVGVVYQLMANVVLTAGRRVVAPPGCAITGGAALACKLTGDVDGSLLTVSGAAGTVRLDGITVTNANAGASARGIEFASAGSTLIMLNTLSTAAQAGLYVTAVGSLFGFLSAYTATSGSPIDVVAGLAGSFLQCSTAAVAAAAKHVRLRAGAAVSTLSFRNHGFIAYGANQVGVAQDGATVSARVTLQQTFNQGPSSGTFVPNGGTTGWDQGTSNWLTNDCAGLPDSAAIGGSYAAGFTVPIGAPATWTPIAPAAGTPWLLESDSERFSLASSANGRITYTGSKQRRFKVDGSAVLSKAGGTVEAAIALFVDGVLHAPSVSRGDVTTRKVALAIAPTIVVLNQGQTLDIRVQNVDNTNSLVVSEVAFNANVSAIS